MKKFRLIYISFVALFAMESCQEDISLEAVPTTATFEVSQDLLSYPEGNSVIVSTSENVPHSFAIINAEDSTVAGYATSEVAGTDTIHVTWKGEYNVVFTACYQGGTYEVTKSISVTGSDLDLDATAIYLAGAIDSEKTWYLDLDADGVSKYFNGPLYYYGTDDCWESVTLGENVGSDSWSWCPVWSSNTWIMDAEDFGSMTFDLEGGYHVTVVQKSVSSLGTQSGTYDYDSDDHTMSFSGASLLHNSGFDSAVSDWTSITVLSLTDSTMQLAVLRTESPCLLSYNFITKDYYDSH